MKHSTAHHIIGFECQLAVEAICCRGCILSKTAIAFGLSYILSPWQVIPDRVPIFGYADQIFFLVAGIAIARLLIPFSFEDELAARRGVTYLPGQSRLDRQEMFLARLLSSFAAQWFIMQRRALRTRIHAVSWSRRIGARISAARVTRNPGDRLFALLGYRLWWLFRSPFSARRSDISSLVVVGGAARSGTTLLRTLLARHRLIAGGPEATVFLRRISAPETLAERLDAEPAAIAAWQKESRSQLEFIERIHHAVLEQSGKAIWLEKTPKNAERFGFIRRKFPHAKLVHIVRDGRDVVCSLRQTSFAKLDGADKNSVAAARRCAVQWIGNVKAARRFRSDPAYYELRYEDLVGSPEPALRALLSFLDLPWDPSVLASKPAQLRDTDETTAAGMIFETSVGRWRRDLSRADREALQLLAGPLLVELGYEAGLDWRCGKTCPPRRDARRGLLRPHTLPVAQYRR